MAPWTPPPLPPELEAASATPFVGRRRELEALEDAWRSVGRRFRQVLFIGGEPGVGKTRLAAQVGRVLSAEGAVVLVGTSPAEFPVPYQPFVEMLDHLLGETEAGALAEVLPDSAGELARLTRWISRHRPDLGLDMPRDGEYRREMFDAYVDLLTATSVDRPVVLILEDLHRARVPTLQLLSHIVGSTSDSQLLILATLRTTVPDRSDELTYAVAEMYRLPGVQRLDLSGLDVEAIAQLLAGESGARSSLLRSSATVLRDQTGGNPFFLKEVWRELAGSGGIDALRREFRAPRSVRDALGLRIGGLDPSQAQAIQLAALIGESFELAILCTASPLTDNDTLDAVDAANAIGLIEADQTDAGRYRFVHALARRAALDRVSVTEGARAHVSIAEALEARASDSPEIVARLAHHYTAAAPLGYEGKAAVYLRRSADFASRSLAHEEAAADYQRAAALRSDEHDELVLLAAQSLVAAGDFERARELFRHLSSAIESETRLRAAIGYEDASWRPGRFGHRAVDLLSDALESYPHDDADPLYVRAIGSLGRAFAFTGADDEARRLGDRAIALARSHGDPRLVAHSVQASLWRALVPETAGEQLARAQEVSGIALANRAYDLLGPAAYFRAAISYLRGHRWDLVAAHSDLRRVATTTGQPFFEYMVGCLDASEQFRRGDFAACRSAVEQLSSVGEAFGQDDTEGSYGLQMFMVQRETGALERVRALVTGDETWHDHWLPGLLALYTELGLVDPAKRVLAQLLSSELEAERHSVQWPAIAAFLVDAIEMLGDVDAARRLLPILDRHRGCNLIAGQFVAVFGSADRYLAKLNALIEDPSADELFRAALDMDTAMGSLVHQAETLAAYGRYLEKGSDRSLRDRAGEYRKEAIRIATTTGHKRVLNALEETMDLPAGLTYREVDVIRLLAEGLSNKEIGARLHISQNTAANHVRSILLKTGSPNRTRAAVFAAQENLLD